MSLFAGVYSRHDDLRPDENVTRIIEDQISRNHDSVWTFRDDRLFIAKIDIGAFNDSGVLIDADSVAALAGDPICGADNAHGAARSRDLARLSSSVHDRPLILRDCQGTYSLCSYRRPTGELLIATDKVGVRPVFYCVTETSVLFSSSLRLLRRVPGVPQRMDLRAVVEELALGYSLANHTPYADIRVLRSGEFLEARGRQFSLARYHRWEEIGSSSFSTEERLDGAYQLFRSAVRSRIPGSSPIISQLSGGLDSRCVVAALLSLEQEVTAVHFSRGQDHQDTIFAEAYARTTGVPLRLIPIPNTRWSWGGLTATALHRKGDHGCSSKPPAMFVFSGDGGSVGLGHVYVDEPLTSLFLKESTTAAVQHYSRSWNPSRRGVFTPAIAAQLKDVVREGVEREIAALPDVTPLEAFHIFLLNNDQRCHLYDHYENIDLHRIEYLLPFFDGKFLEFVVSNPIEVFLRHRFYHEWLKQFPPSTVAVPWQTYPGHERCPIPLHGDYRYQWESSRRESFEDSQLLFRECKKVVLARRFPTELLRRSRVVSALVLHALRVRNYAHVFKITRDIQRYYSECNGNVCMPD